MHLQDPAAIQAIWLSLRTSVIATALSAFLGTPLAYLLARRQVRGRRFLETLLDLPLVLPPAVAGVALLIAFGRRGVIGGFLSSLGLQVTFTPLAVILAQMFVASPFFLRAAIVGFSAVDEELTQAASLDGAGEWALFRHVVLPLAHPALLSGAVLTWARALGEFGATIIFAGNLPGRTQTMPLAIYLGFELDLNVALTLSVILLGFSFLVLLTVRSLSSQAR
jgi:molybdate transport system permease protein